MLSSSGSRSSAVVAVVAVAAAVVVVVVNGEEGDGETQSSSRSSARPCTHGDHRFRGFQPSLVVVAMAGGYSRIELDHCLDIDEVAKLMKSASKGLMVDFKPAEPKATNGKVDAEGAHYSSYNWEGTVKMPRTASGCGRKKKVIIGITDYEYFSKDKKHCARRADHCHFMAIGTDAAVLQVIDVFKAVIPSTLWRDVDTPREVHDCKQWAPQDRLINKVRMSRYYTNNNNYYYNYYYYLTLPPVTCVPLILGGLALIQKDRFWKIWHPPMTRVASHPMIRVASNPHTILRFVTFPALIIINTWHLNTHILRRSLVGVFPTT